MCQFSKRGFVTYSDALNHSMERNHQALVGETLWKDTNFGVVVYMGK